MNQFNELMNFDISLNTPLHLQFNPMFSQLYLNIPI